jgi:hypothetical protein
MRKLQGVVEGDGMLSVHLNRFQRGLPAALTTVNEECLRMEPSDAHVEQPLGDMVSAIEHAMQPVVDDEEFHHGGEDDEFGARRTGRLFWQHDEISHAI